MTLEEYLHKHFPNHGNPGNSTDDKAIAVMREMDLLLRSTRGYVASRARIADEFVAQRQLAEIDRFFAEVSK